jgi:cellulose biosynthesis protein BcsQ
VNLAHALANRGKKVLVIDQDPQCNSTSALLPAPISHKGDRSLYDIYSGSDISAKDCIYKTQYDDVSILPNLSITASLEHQLYQDISASYMLGRKIISEISDDYDFIIYDCPPTLGLWVLIALISSDCAIVPVVVGSKYALDGLVAAIDAIEGVSRTANPSLKFLRLLINRVDLRTSASKVTVDFIKSRFGVGKVFETTIPENTQIQQAELAGKTVLRHAPQSVAAKRYRDLADEFLRIVEEDQPALEL